MKVYILFDYHKDEFISIFFEEDILLKFMRDNKYNRYSSRVIVTTGYDETDNIFDDIE